MPPSLHRLCHTHLAIGVAAYRISSFRLVNPRKCNIQAMQVWTLSSVRLGLVAMSQSLNLCRPSDKLGPTLHFFPKDADEVNLHVRIMTALAVTICSKQFRLP